jgi:Fe2+ or Zn2+ uptake regulation protein
MGEGSEFDEAVIERLGARELRYTTGRRLLVRGLRASPGPVTLPELLALVPELSQSSAYRNLALLEDARVVRRVVHGTDHARFELAEELTGHHHHLICTRCGLVRDVVFTDSVEQVLDDAIDQLGRDGGFVPAEHTIDVYGRCTACGD